jgi:signal transduction histidine kinase
VALRPDALHDLGLASALLSLCERLSQGTGISVDWQVEHELPEWRTTLVSASCATR